MNAQTTVIVPAQTPVTVVPGESPALIVAEHRGFAPHPPYRGPERRHGGTRSQNGLRLGASVFDQVREEGVDNPPAHVVESGYGVDAGTTEPLKENFVEATQVNESAQAQAPASTEAPKELTEAQAAAKAKADARAAELQAAAKAKAEKQEAAKKAREEKAAAAQAAKDQRAAERAARPPRDPNAPMIALSEKVKAGVYVKGVNGQLRTNDDVAIALEAIPAKKMVPFLLQVLQAAGVVEAGKNPYEALNYGQQSMNLRNRLRGALKKGVEFGEPKVKLTLDFVKAIRDEGNFTTAEQEPAKQGASAPVSTPAPTLSDAAAVPGGAAATPDEQPAEAAPSDAGAARKGRKGRK